MRILSSVFVSVLLYAASPVLALPDTYSSWPTASLFKHGVDALKEGRELEVAVAMLTVATQRKPNHADYQLALGCACAGRIASLASAIESITIADGAQRMYKKRLNIWQQIHNNPDLPLFNTPLPAQPSPPTTPDDGKALNLSENDAQNLIQPLAQKALTAFHRAYMLSRSLGAGSRTRIDYVCGWGMLLLRRCAGAALKFRIATQDRNETEKNRFERQARAFQDDNVLAQDDILACFQECVDYDKKGAKYWQALAYANAPDYLRSFRRVDDDDNLGRSPANRIAEALQAFRRALAIKRGDADLISQAALVALLVKPAEARDLLQQLASTPHQNAVCSYLLAEACLRSTEHQQDRADELRDAALTALEAGNQAADYRSLALVLPTPEWLQAAWAYDQCYGAGMDHRCLDELFGYLSPLGNELADHKEADKLVRLGKAMMQTGLQAIRHFDGGDLDIAEPHAYTDLYARAFFGMVFCSKADQYLRHVAAMAPTDDNVALTAQLASSRAYWQAWETALTSR